MFLLTTSVCMAASTFEDGLEIIVQSCEDPRGLLRYACTKRQGRGSGPYFLFFFVEVVIHDDLIMSLAVII